MTSPAPKHNRLVHESSPYLLQHADNPVDWYPWGTDALALARETGKPILLSIGYAACHWCHAMAHESFEDEATAALMNQLFINIKVDREERPDIDQIYMNAVHAMGVQGGWPLTMFLTPEGKPYWGGTYFPPEPRHGMPAFPQVLKTLAAAYAEKPDKMIANTDALSRHLADIYASTTIDGEVPTGLPQSFGQRLLQLQDPNLGGIKGAPKFPNAPMTETLALLSRETPIQDKPAEDGASHETAFLRTIDSLCMGGIYDHLAGGIARYTVDERWLIPHFEKMLYDNAHFVRQATYAWQITRNDLYRYRIEQTVKWLENEMTSPEGAFYSSLDADSEAEEGKFYVWSFQEVSDILGANPNTARHLEDFLEFYDISPGGNWEGKNILNRLDGIAADPAVEEQLAGCREALLAHRSTRVRPGTDDKILTDWNGYMIEALTHAAITFGQPRWLEMAEGAYRFISESNDDERGYLLHSQRKGTGRIIANASDYGSMMNAAIALYQANANQDHVRHAEAWAQILQHDFSDGMGGFYLTSAKQDDLIVRPKGDFDDANPSASSRILYALTDLALITGNTNHQQQAEALSKSLYAASRNKQFGLAGYMNAQHHLEKGIHVACFGTLEQTCELATLLAKTNRFKLTVSHHDPAQTKEIPDHIIAPSDTKVPGAVVCQGNTCSLPFTQEPELFRYINSLI